GRLAGEVVIVLGTSAFHLPFCALVGGTPVRMGSVTLPTGKAVCGAADSAGAIVGFGDMVWDNGEVGGVSFPTISASLCGSSLPDDWACSPFCSFSFAKSSKPFGR